MIRKTTANQVSQSEGISVSETASNVAKASVSPSQYSEIETAEDAKTLRIQPTTQREKTFTQTYLQRE